MTREEAYKAMQEGEEVFHDNCHWGDTFYIKNGVITSDDNKNLSEMFWSDTGCFGKDNWNVISRKKETNI